MQLEIVRRSIAHRSIGGVGFQSMINLIFQSVVVSVVELVVVFLSNVEKHLLAPHNHHFDDIST